MKRLIIGIIMVFELFAAGAILASPKKQDKKNQVVVDNKAMKIFLDKIEIYGRIAKPQTVFIIPGSDPRVNGIRIERRFFSDMFRKVEKSTLRKQWIKDQRKKDHILW